MRVVAERQHTLRRVHSYFQPLRPSGIASCPRLPSGQRRVDVDIVVVRLYPASWGRGSAGTEPDTPCVAWPSRH
jgi:hypothetical protein